MKIGLPAYVGLLSMKDNLVLSLSRGCLTRNNDTAPFIGQVFVAYNVLSVDLIKIFSFFPHI